MQCPVDAKAWRRLQLGALQCLEAPLAAPVKLLSRTVRLSGTWCKRVRAARDRSSPVLAESTRLPAVRATVRHCPHLRRAARVRPESALLAPMGSLRTGIAAQLRHCGARVRAYTTGSCFSLPVGSSKPGFLGLRSGVGRCFSPQTGARGDARMPPRSPPCCVPVAGSHCCMELDRPHNLCR
jgi:hypothetical protein